MMRIALLCFFHALLLLLTGNVHVMAQTQSLERGAAIRDTAILNKELKAVHQITRTFPDSAFTIAKQLLESSQAAQYHYGTTAAYIELGNIYRAKGAYKQAIDYYGYGIRSADKGQQSLLAELYNHTGSMYTYLSQYEQAAKYYTQAISYAEKYPSADIPVETIYLNYGNVFSNLKQYGKAEYYFRKVLDKGRKEQQPSFIAGSLINLASLAKKRDQDSLGIAYLNEAITLSRKYNFPDKLHDALSNLGGIRMKQNKLEEALELCLQAKAVGAKYPINPNHKNTVIANIGFLYLELKNYTEAEKYLLMAAAAPGKTPAEQKIISGQLAELNFSQGKYKQAYQYFKRFHEISDSLSGNEVAARVSEIETQYRSAEKDKEIISNKLTISQQKNNLDKKNFLIGGILLGCIILIAAIRVYYLYKNRKLKSEKELEQLKAFMEGEERERNRLSRDLHDGVNSQLTAIRLHLGALKSKPPELYTRQDFQDIELMLGKTANDVRRVAHNLAPGELIANGLSRSITEFCDHLFAGSHIETDLQVYPGIDEINPEMALQVYRIVQELAHNIIKHAAATRVVLLLLHSGNELQIIVEDNGKGMGESSNNVVQSGLGLKSVQNRVHSYKGNLSVTSDHKGTVISITLPLLADNGL